MNISIELQIQKRKIEYKNNENNTKAKGEISMDFTGKNIIVTGGASGIGKAIVTGVVEGGGHAIIVDLNLDAAEKLREELGKDKTSAYKVNLANSAEIREVFGKIVADFKQIHGLINNAGIVSTVPFDEVTQAEWDKVIAINLTGVYTAISAVYPSMKANGYGRIVNVASVAAKRGGGLLGTSAYAASKQRNRADKGGCQRRRTLWGCLQWCMPQLNNDTDDCQYGRRKDKEDYRNHSLGRGAQPREIANMVLFYASDLAALLPVKSVMWTVA